MRKRYRANYMLIAAALVIGFVFCLHGVSERNIQTIARVPGQVKTVIIDPGHGGMDGGAVGIDGIIEKGINLNIALKLKDLLALGGFEVVMTREDDRSIHDPDAATIKSQKSSDLKNRLKMMSEYPDAVFLSIHQNQYAEESSKGAQVFYTKGNEDSKELAGIMQKKMVEFLDPQNHRREKPAGKEIYIIYHAPVPALLIECGFISNYEEAKKLVSDEYQEQVAFSIYSGLMEWLEAEQSELPSKGEAGSESAPQAAVPEEEQAG